MRTLLTALAFAATLALGAPVGVVAVLILAGPHSDLLPDGAALPLAGLAAVALLTLAMLAARHVWRRCGQPAAA